MKYRTYGTLRFDSNTPTLGDLAGLHAAPREIDAIENSTSPILTSAHLTTRSITRQDRG